MKCSTWLKNESKSQKVNLQDKVIKNSNKVNMNRFQGWKREQLNSWTSLVFILYLLSLERKK